MSVVVGELACTIGTIRNTLEPSVLSELAYNKMLLFQPLAFISSFYFYVNIGNMRTRIIPLKIHFSIIHASKCD